MTLDELLQVMDRAAANLAKLQAIWDRAELMIPSRPQRGTSREYEDLCRAWASLLAGLPPIDGFTVTEQRPDIDAAGQSFIDYFEIGVPVFDLMNELERPGHQLADYRFKLAQARRRAIRDRLHDLISTINVALGQIAETIARDSTVRVSDPRATVVEDAITEIERLLGDTTERKGRWDDLHRHLRFSEGHDWHDIAEMDWPSVRDDVEAATLSESDPLAVPPVDLGVAASARPAGGASIGLEWAALTTTHSNACYLIC